MNMESQSKTRAYTTICLLLALWFMACQSEPEREVIVDPDKSVDVNWTWKRTANNNVNVIYGTVRNKGENPIREVVLEFRTQNESGETLTVRKFAIRDLPPGGQKPFTQDYPAQHAREDSGFVKVVAVIPGE